MFSIFSISMMLLIISLLMIMISTILAKQLISDREKNSPFECGFDPSSHSRLPFSLHFYLISIIFLVFDVEIALILPMIVTLKSSNIMVWAITSIFFVMILLTGLYHEWNQGVLNWNN